MCTEHTLHACSLPGRACNECINYEEHIKTATIAREMYKKDAENNDENNKFSADLPKVVMLPRMPGIRTVVFTNRITA